MEKNCLPLKLPIVLKAAILASHNRALNGVLAALPAIQCPSNAPEKEVEDGQVCKPLPAIHMGDQTELLALGLA